ncbi:hypothetical protein FB45DRAFT_1018556 [Roridomyces roridus]|uniref:Uncharacterized protein n=1 Tax=Roridomyces roridus TaxID=1738132 RepID=A0AAD7CL13_9AGAR|nr:hypothetical protein FB45DRAFT_1018556 [Roridomyces roridus]
MSKEALEVLGTTAGHSLQQLSLSMTSTQLSPSDMANFTALRVLYIEGRRLEVAGLESPRPDALQMLDTLRIHSSRFGRFIQLFVDMRLENLHTLGLSDHSDDALDGLRAFMSAHGNTSPENRHTHELSAHSDDASNGLPAFLNVHGNKLLHLTIESTHAFPTLDQCPNLLDIKISSDCDLADLVSNTPHKSLSKIVVSDIESHIKKIEFDTEMFPALREIQILELGWPTTERAIAKSRFVRFAEFLLQKNIKLTNSEEKAWTPRLKTGKGRRAS